MDKDKEQKWYFTFMGNSPLKNNYEMYTGTYGGAREKMVENYGVKWAFQYNEDEFTPQIDRFGLSRV